MIYAVDLLTVLVMGVLWVKVVLPVIGWIFR